MTKKITREHDLITDRVSSTREGYVLTRVCLPSHPSVCSQGGVPQLGPAREGTLARSSQEGCTPCRGVLLPGRTPCRVSTQSGVSKGWGSNGGYPRWGTLPAGYPLYRTTDGVLDTPWSVCLLRSRRRTFLFVIDNLSCRSGFVGDT